MHRVELQNTLTLFPAEGVSFLQISPMFSIIGYDCAVAWFWCLKCSVFLMLCFVCCLALADDMMMLGSSVAGLQSMLNTSVTSICVQLHVHV